MMISSTLRLQLAAALAGLALVSGLVLQTSSAAFSATTANGSNTFEAGTVTITDDDAGSALFALGPMKPGDGATKCLLVNYDGNLLSTVKLYGAIGGGTSLGQYLDVTINSGTGAADDTDCASFVAGTQIYSGTLADFAATHTAWADGLTDANFEPDDTSDTRAYRVAITLQDANAAQGLTATGVTFTWEAQNQ